MEKIISKPKNDLTNQKFNLLTALEYVGNSSWKCQCECGNIKVVKTSALTSGKTKSCGCLIGKNTKNNTRNSKPKQDLTGQKFGKLTALEYIKGGKWECECECGNHIIVDTRNLNSGHTKSCGCLVKEINSKNYTIDMTNFENDGILVLSHVGSDNQGVALWECKCKICGNIFTARGAGIRAGTTKSCGCVHSWNERKITHILKENNINFISQYTFPDLLGINGGHLRFDFAIFEDNKLKHLIEFNGKQHYEKPKNKWGEKFEDLQINDQIKKDYCKKNNIELRIIKYDEEYSLIDLI